MFFVCIKYCVSVIPVFIIIIDKSLLFTFLLSEENTFQHIFKCSPNLFVKLITITSIFEKYSNKNNITFNRRNLRLQNKFD